jgi:hypothetical protein
MWQPMSTNAAKNIPENRRKPLKFVSAPANARVRTQRAIRRSPLERNGKAIKARKMSYRQDAERFKGVVCCD